MAKGAHECTASGRWRAPPLEEILRWIHEAWFHVSEIQIKNSFLYCGISNATDGSEDSEILFLRGENGEEISQVFGETDGIGEIDFSEEDEKETEENEIVIDETEGHTL